MPRLNTTSTADISFILLAFFLMTSSMDHDMGLLTILPAADRTEEVKDIEVSKENVLHITLDASDSLRCNGEITDSERLKISVKTFVENATDKHIILLAADRHTSYDAYFNVQHTIAEAYLDLRNTMAHKQFGHDYRSCTPNERAAIGKRYPWRLSEAEQLREGGEP